MIEFTATLGVMPVRKELVAAPKALLTVHTVFGERNESARSIIWTGRTSVPVFDDVMDGGIPPIPL